MARTTGGRDAVSDALRDRIVSGLHLGRLAGGARLPSTRALAAEFGVNERVVLAALRTLADEGFVVLRPRSGAYVAPPHPSAGGTLPDLGAWLVGVLVQARARGVPPREVSEYVRRALETRRLRAACVECNDDQRHLLCTELAADHGFETEGAELDALHDAEPPLAVRRADLLVTTQFHRAEVQAAAERLGKPWVVISLRPEIMRDVGRHLQAGPLYVVATDPRFAPKLRQMFGPLGPAQNLRLLLMGRDDLASVPADAPTYVMSSARERLAAPGPGRPIQPPRVFSDESARELLTFIVRANVAALAVGMS